MGKYFLMAFLRDSRSLFLVDLETSVSNRINLFPEGAMLFCNGNFLVFKWTKKKVTNFYKPHKKLAVQSLRHMSDFKK